MAFTTQPLSVAVQYSAAQVVAEALGLSVAVRVGHVPCGHPSASGA